MKKLIYAVAAVGMLASFNSCTQTPKATFNSETDSLSYAIGVMNCDPRMLPALEDQFGIDSTCYEAFAEGFLNGAKTTDKKEIARIIGFQLGMQSSEKSIKQMNSYFFQGDSTKSLSQNNMIAGFIAALKKDKDAVMTTEDARAFMQSFQQRQYEANMAKQYADWKKQNEEFLATNAKNEGVITLESGLQYKIEKEGKGIIATDTTKLKVSYTGKLIDGTEFDSSYKTTGKSNVKKNTPFECTPSSGIIKGWKEILKTVPVGTKCTIYVPAELGYGAQNTGRIKPFSTLIFDIEIAE